jgi:Bacterial Ig-like domain (group 1)
MFTKTFLCAAAVLLAASLQGCGGNGAGAAGGGSAIVADAISEKATSVVAITSQPNLPTDGKTTSTITVIVKDAGNRALQNAVVDISTNDSGSTIQQATTKTAADGTVAATLTSTGKSNRVITVKAVVGTKTVFVEVPVSGTSLTLSGAQSLSLNGTGDYTLALRDSSGAAFTNTDVVLKSKNGNTFTPAAVKTDSNGQAKFKITATQSGSDLITAEAAGASISIPVNVAPIELAITSVTTNATATEEVVVNASSPKQINIKFSKNGAPLAGKVLNVSATRGVITTLGAGATATTVTTDASGTAAFSITSTSAGFSTMSVSDTSTSDTKGSVTTAQIEFVSRIPATVKIQASKSVVPINAIGASGNASQLVASVLDAAGNPVKGIDVNFSAVSDPSSGRIEPGTAKTDSAGIATVAFIAGPKTTGPDQVKLRALIGAVPSVAPSDALLTVASPAISIRLGTGNKIEVNGSTRYKYPWNAVVVDSSGAPIQDAVVSVQVVPVGYYKGSWVLSTGTTPTWGRGAYVTDSAGNYMLDAMGNFIGAPAEFCRSEDTSPQDGALQAGEDINGTGKLEPGNVATSSVGIAGQKTGANGFIDFDVVYAKSYALFTTVRIDVKAQVAGTESTVSQEFLLPILKDDAADNPPVIPGTSAGPFGRIVFPQTINAVSKTACQNPN